jgi:hypothetical protein
MIAVPRSSAGAACVARAVSAPQRRTRIVTDNLNAWLISRLTPRKNAYSRHRQAVVSISGKIAKNERAVVEFSVIAGLEPAIHLLCNNLFQE